MAESNVQNAVRLAAARQGIHLWRNNVGVLLDRRGVPVRYGLANESKQMNQVLKSGDLIGWTSTGRFISVEIKDTDGIVMPGQEAWRALVEACGGIAIIARGPEDLRL